MMMFLMLQRLSWLVGIAYSLSVLRFFFFKQKTAYEMRISDWSSDVCSSDLAPRPSNAASPTPTLASAMIVRAGSPSAEGPRIFCNGILQTGERSPAHAGVGTVRVCLAWTPAFAGDHLAPVSGV